MRTFRFLLILLAIPRASAAALDCGRVLLTSGELMAVAASPRWQQMGTKLIDAGFLAPQNELVFPRSKLNPKLEEHLNRLKSSAPGWAYLTFFARLYQRIDAVYGRETADQLLEATLFRADETRTPQTLSPVLSANEVWRSSRLAGGGLEVVARGGELAPDKRERGVETYLGGVLWELRATLNPQISPLDRLATTLGEQEVSCRQSHRGGILECEFSKEEEGPMARFFPNRDTTEKFGNEDGFIAINLRGEYPLLVAASPYRFTYESSGTLLSRVRGGPRKVREGILLKLSPAISKLTLADINLVFEAQNQTSD